MDQNRLIRHIRESSGVLEPLPTGEQAMSVQLDGIRAFVFDVYGTLFISGSGDISLARKEDRSPALRAALATAGYRVLVPEAPWSARLMEALDNARARRADEGVRHPEVRIEEVWASFVEAARSSGWLEGEGDLGLAIVDYECRVNPCWPMPGLAETLHSIAARGVPMGIVSNAQFYTPLLFEALLGSTLAECGFDEELCVWSYREREGKPSRALYSILKHRLAGRGIKPAQALYIGNDLRNDIRPARAEGFRTALFAGDARSLRWRREDPGCAGVRPDSIVTGLRQLTQA